MALTMTFCGAAGTVTGSCYLLRHPGGAFLVDCGMFQGPKTLKELNYGAFPFDPRKIDFVLLTHAHVDHSGLVPKLIRHGFSGPIYATEGTRDLLSYMLPDSGYIQESEVEHLNRRNRQRGRPPVEPIYTRADGVRALEAFRTVDYDRWSHVGEGVRARFWNAGHILGSASIEIEIATGEAEPERLRMLFSGDLGPEHKIFHPDPEGPENLDHVICESTYGGRSRPTVTPRDRRRQFADEVNRALADGGLLLIPSFAIERTQELLADLAVLMAQGQVPRVPVFLDSPLAIRATEVFDRHAGDLEDTAGPRDLFHLPNLHFAETVDESKAIARFTSGAIIMAASGMCEAGRIRHHLKNYLWRDNATVLIVGYQAPGTLGALLLEGRKDVRIMGEDVKVRAEIRQIDLYSGHADGDELVEWVKERLPISRTVFLTHGEESALAALRDGLVAAGCEAERVVIPRIDDEVDLLGKGPVRPERKGPRRLEPEAVSALDWHNDLAQFSLDLRAELEQAADERARKAILRRMRRALEGAEE